MFRREGGFDLPPYSAIENYAESDARQFLIVAPDGRPIGGAGAIQDTFEDTGSLQWLWTWIWIIPSERRKGHMRATWNMMKDIVPGVVPDPPFSLGAASFFVNRSDVPEWVRKAAADVRDAGE
jgi:hypothetical protein